MSDAVSEGIGAGNGAGLSEVREQLRRLADAGAGGILEAWKIERLLGYMSWAERRLDVCRLERDDLRRRVNEHGRAMRALQAQTAERVTEAEQRAQQLEWRSTRTAYCWRLLEAVHEASQEVAPADKWMTLMDRVEKAVRMRNDAGHIVHKKRKVRRG